VIDANCEKLSCSEVKERIRKSKPNIVTFSFTPTTIETDMKTARITKSLYPNAVTVDTCWTLKRFAEKTTSSLSARIILEYVFIRKTESGVEANEHK